MKDLGYISHQIGLCLSQIRGHFDSFRDLRKGSNTSYSIGELVLGGFSVFLLNNSSFLEQQRLLKKRTRGSNYENLLLLKRIPSDGVIRDNLDEISPTEVLKSYAPLYESFQAQGVFKGYKYEELGCLLSFDGTQTMVIEPAEILIQNVFVVIVAIVAS